MSWELSLVLKATVLLVTDGEQVPLTTTSKFAPLSAICGLA